MVAINKRPVRLLCSLSPPREYRSLFFLLGLFPPRTHDHLSLSLSLLLLFFSSSLPLFLEFPAVVISEPREGKARRRRKYFTSAEEGKITDCSPSPPLPSRCRPTPSSDRACQRHCRMQGGMERTIEKGERRRMENHDGLCTFYEINSYVRHISGWLIVTALATEINSRD